MRVIVCGGRDLDDWVSVWAALDELSAMEGPFEEVIHGGARGVDRHAARWAASRGLQVHECRADWDAYGKRAGHIRNQLMLDEFDPDIVIAFPGGRGTGDMIDRANLEGYRVIEVEI